MIRSAAFFASSRKILIVRQISLRCVDRVGLGIFFVFFEEHNRATHLILHHSSDFFDVEQPFAVTKEMLPIGGV